MPRAMRRWGRNSHPLEKLSGLEIAAECAACRRRANRTNRDRRRTTARGRTDEVEPMLDVSTGQVTSTRPIRLVIADRQPIVLQGLRSVFAAQYDFEIVAACSCGTSCLDAIRNLAPDVALVADGLPHLTASEIAAIAKAENLPTRLVLFGDADGDKDLALGTGASGAISRYADPDVMVRSLRLTTEFR